MLKAAGKFFEIVYWVILVVSSLFISLKMSSTFFEFIFNFLCALLGLSFMFMFLIYPFFLGFLAGLIIYLHIGIIYLLGYVLKSEWVSYYLVGSTALMALSSRTGRKYDIDQFGEGVDMDGDF